MEKQEILKVVISAITKVLMVDAEECTLDANLRNDLATDSLDEVELTMELEMKFGLPVKDIEIEHIKTIGDIVDFVEKKLKDK